MSPAEQALPRADKPLEVVIAGAGIAGLETLMALRDLAGDRVSVTLVAAEPDFVYTPLVVGEPFAAAHAGRRPLGPIAAELGARLVHDRVTGVATDDRFVELAELGKLSYEALAVCIGAHSRPAYHHVLTFSATGDPLAINGVLADIEEGYASRVNFLVPPGATWTLPIYELALMTRRQAWSMGFDVRCTIVTPEPAPLVIFGTAASEAVSKLLTARGIEVIPRSYARQTGTGSFVLAPGDRELEPGRTVALPVPHGPRIPGLPSDGDGFIPTDELCRVGGLDGVYAAGDGTTFPIKQGGIATQQADVVAAQIAARAGAKVEPERFRPVLRGKLLTGAASLFLRHGAAGGAGAGGASEDYLWWPPHKVSGRYLSPWLAGAGFDPAPPVPAVDIDVPLTESSL